MKTPHGFATFAVPMLFKAVLLAARWAGGRRRRAIEALARRNGEDKEREILLLRDKVSRLEALVGLLQRQIAKGPRRPRYTLHERLCVLWHLEYFQVPRRRVHEYFGIARSTLYRWLHLEESLEPLPRKAANRTSAALTALVWEIARANPAWGRFRIAGQLALLKVFLSASTVRNVLLRPHAERPKAPDGAAAPAFSGQACKTQRPIPARYPNHVWSVDLTTVARWGLWPTYVLVAIDHFSRRIVAVKPLEGPNPAWVIGTLEEAFDHYGAPKHLITDRGVQFTSGAFREFLERFAVKPRFGAVGKHGSIAVTERAIQTLKYEWLRRVPLLKGFDHLETLSADFALWYNRFRPHMALGGRRPGDLYHHRPFCPPKRADKSVPAGIRRHVFKATRTTAYSLEESA